MIWIPNKVGEVTLELTYTDKEEKMRDGETEEEWHRTMNARRSCPCGDGLFRNPPVVMMNCPLHWRMAQVFVQHHDLKVQLKDARLRLREVMNNISNTLDQIEKLNRVKTLPLRDLES